MKQQNLTDAEKAALDLQMGITVLDSRAVIKTPYRLTLGAPVPVAAARATTKRTPPASSKPKARDAKRLALAAQTAEDAAIAHDLDVRMGLVESRGVIKTPYRLTLGTPVRTNGAK